MPNMSEQLRNAQFVVALGAQALQQVYREWASAVLRLYWLTKEMESSTHA